MYGLFLLIKHNNLFTIPLLIIKSSKMMGCYSKSMETNLLITILLPIYILALLAIDVVAYRILYLQMRLGK
jgi:hypothetical protein